MRRIWLAVILLSVVTAVVLAYTWQNIPYVNTFLIDNGVITTVQGVTTGISDAVNNMDPKSLLGIISGSIGSFFLIGRSLLTKIRESREATQELRVLAQQEKGSLLAGFNDAKETLTGEKEKLQKEYDSLQDVAALKDETITKLQQQINDVQTELTSAQTSLLKATTQRDEFKIKNLELTTPSRD